MKDGTTYPRNTALAFLLAGNPGSGKTVTLFSFPDPWIGDCEGNLKSGIDRNPGKRFWFDSPRFDHNDKGEVVKVYLPHEAWPRLEAQINAAGASPLSKVMGLDGLHKAADFLKDWLVYTAGKSGEKLPIVGGQPQMTQALWGEYGRRIRSLILLLRSFGKPVVVTVHLAVDENEMSGVKEYRVNIQGRSALSLAGDFTDFYHLSSTPNSDSKYAKNGGVRYFMRTATTNRLELKSHNNQVIPAEMELGDAAWTKLIASLTPPTTPPPSGGAQ